MNASNIPVALPNLQGCDPGTFFFVLDRIDQTALKDAIAGPGRRGPKLKELGPSIRLYLWYRWRGLVDSDDSPTPTGLRRELEDPESELAMLCGFDKSKKLPDRKTFSNHFDKFEQQPDLVDVVLREISKWVPSGGPDEQSRRPKTAEKAKKPTGSKNRREPTSRNAENVRYRERRRQEAVGFREITDFLADVTLAEDFLWDAIHGGLRSCYICPKKQANGWTCTKGHVHKVVVEVLGKQGRPRPQKCRCCGFKLSLTSETAFSGTNLSPQEIFIVLYEMVRSRRGVSSQDVAGALNKRGRNVSENAAFMLMQRLRECMRDDRPGNFEGTTEVDEMLLKLADGQLVSLVTFYNRPTRCVRFEIVERAGGKKPKASKREMLKLIRKHTRPGSIIASDGDASIPEPEVMGREHVSVNHKAFQHKVYKALKGHPDRIIEATTNRAEGEHTHVRRSLRLRNGIYRHHLERYLAELAWRSNHQHNRLESQNYEGEERRNLSLIRDVLAGAAGRKLTLRDLRGKPHKGRGGTLGKNRTAPVPAPATYQQRPLMPPGPIVPLAPRSENGRVEIKPHQTPPARQSEGGQVNVKPPQSCPMQLSMALGDSQTYDEQAHPVSTEETTSGSEGAESGPLEELEQIFPPL